MWVIVCYKFLVSCLLYTKITSSASWKQPSGESFLYIIDSLLCQMFNTKWLVPIRFWRMGHCRVVKVLDTVVGVRVASDRGSLLASRTWSNSLMIGIYLAASARKHENILLYPPKRSLGGVYWIHPVRPSVCPSVCPSVRPSVRPSVGRCPDDNSNSFQWI